MARVSNRFGNQSWGDISRSRPQNRLPASIDDLAAEGASICFYPFQDFAAHGNGPFTPARPRQEDVVRRQI